MRDDTTRKNRDDVLEEADQQFFAALTLLCLAILAAGLWAYLVITEGFNGPVL